MMEYRGKGEVFVGRAGILPAAAGMLPGPLSHIAALQFGIRLQREQAVRRNAGQSGQDARAPLQHSRFTI